jgi:hypothetical protein
MHQDHIIRQDNEADILQSAVHGKLRLPGSRPLTPIYRRAQAPTFRPTRHAAQAARNAFQDRHLQESRVQDMATWFLITA